MSLLKHFKAIPMTLSTGTLVGPLAVKMVDFVGLDDPAIHVTAMTFRKLECLNAHDWTQMTSQDTLETRSADLVLDEYRNFEPRADGDGSKKKMRLNQRPKMMVFSLSTALNVNLSKEFKSKAEIAAIQVETYTVDSASKESFKSEVVEILSDETKGNVVVFATSCFSAGVDMKSVTHCIVVGGAHSLFDLCQMVFRVGRGTQRGGRVSILYAPKVWARMEKIREDARKDLSFTVEQQQLHKVGADPDVADRFLGLGSVKRMFDNIENKGCLVRWLEQTMNEGFEVNLSEENCNSICMSCRKECSEPEWLKSRRQPEQTRHVTVATAPIAIAPTVEAYGAMNIISRFGVIRRGVESKSRIHRFCFLCKTDMEDPYHWKNKCEFFVRRNFNLGGCTLCMNTNHQMKDVVNARKSLRAMAGLEKGKADESQNKTLSECCNLLKSEAMDGQCFRCGLLGDHRDDDSICQTWRNLHLVIFACYELINRDKLVLEFPGLEKRLAGRVDAPGFRILFDWAMKERFMEQDRMYPNLIRLTVFFHEKMAKLC
jgi:hypothetical protein